MKYIYYKTMYALLAVKANVYYETFVQYLIVSM